MAETKWLTRSEMAERLRMTTRRLSMLVKDGCPHIFKSGVLGGPYLFNEEEVIEWLRKRTKQAYKDAGGVKK